MGFALKMQQVTARYAAAKQAVLSKWQLLCGCASPGGKHECEGCPCLAVFEQKIREQMAVDRLSESEDLNQVA